MGKCKIFVDIKRHPVARLFGINGHHLFHRNIDLLYTPRKTGLKRNGVVFKHESISGEKPNIENNLAVSHMLFGHLHVLGHRHREIRR